MNERADANASAASCHASGHSPGESAGRSIIASGLCLFVVLVAVKWTVVREASALRDSPTHDTPRLAAGLAFVGELALAVEEDALVVMVLSALAAMLACPWRRPRLARIVTLGTSLLFAALAIYTVAGLKLWRAFHSWLTYPLYFHSGGLTELDMGVKASLSVLWLAKLAGIGVGFLLIQQMLARRQSTWWLATYRAIGRPAVWLALLAMLLTIWSIVPSAGRPERQNPYLTLASSYLINSAGIGRELTLGPSWSKEFGATEAEQRRPQPPSGQLPAARLKSLPAKRPQLNVVVVVLESVGARFLHLYGAPWSNTDTLEQLAERGVVFDNVYAHASLTAESIVAINSSVYPRSDTRLTSWENPALSVPDLAETLAAHGYRSALVSQTFLGRGIRGYVAARHFDMVVEASAPAANGSAANGSAAKGSGGGAAGGRVAGDEPVDDARLAREGLRWIDLGSQGKPFLLMLWTYQTHYPYYAAEPIAEAEPGKPQLNRFVAATRAADEMLRELVEGLRRRGLWESTLLVVTGDHGQCYHPRLDMSGARDLRESSVHVPLVIACPALFAAGRRSPTLGQHIDLGPTVLDLLGIAAPAEWQGRSMFAADRSPRAYFIDKLEARPIYGLREGDYKFLLAPGGRELYDCRRDPDERRNLANDRPELCDRLYKRLVAWYRFQAGYLDQFN
jgi:arylsulfatase A-like enzyme